jgi:hypothetical protein
MSIRPSHLPDGWYTIRQIPFLKILSLAIVLLIVFTDAFSERGNPFYKFLHSRNHEGYAFVKFQTILVPIGIGFSWNFVQGAVFGSPVSGVVFDGLFSMTIIPREVSSGGSLGPILLS